MDFQMILDYLKDQHFYIGIIAGIVFVFLAWIVLKIWNYCHHRCKSLIINEEGGRFEISCDAMQSFVSSVLERYQEIQTCRVRIINGFDKHSLEVVIKINQNGNVVQIRNSVREYLYAELRDKLGIADKFSAINFRISQLPPSNQLQA